MTRSGIQFPDVIDLTTKASDGTIRLVLAETEALTGNHEPHQMIVIFLRHYRTLLEKQGLGLEVSLNQEDLPV